MKCAVIIVYEGTAPSVQAQRDAIQGIAQYGNISDLENIDVYTLNEAEILSAIVAKAVPVDDVQTFEKPEEWAAKIVINDFLEAVTSKDYDTFSVALSIRLSSELIRRPETDFMKAVRILTKEHAENNISESQRNYLDDRMFQIMRRSFYLVCQGRHIVFQ